LLHLGALLKTQAIAVVHLEALCFGDAVLDVRMKLAGSDDLLERFNGRVAGGKISVDCRLQFVQMNADIRGKLSAIEIRSVQLDYGCARPFQILDRLVRDTIDLAVDGCRAEETAQYADALALETIGLQEFRVVVFSIDIPDARISDARIPYARIPYARISDTPCRCRIVRVIADEDV